MNSGGEKSTGFRVSVKFVNGSLKKKEVEGRRLSATQRGSFLLTKLLFDTFDIKNVSAVSVLSLCLWSCLRVRQVGCDQRLKRSALWWSSTGIRLKITTTKSQREMTHALSLFDWYGCHSLSFKSSDRRRGRDRWNSNKYLRGTRDWQRKGKTDRRLMDEQMSTRQEESGEDVEYLTIWNYKCHHDC